MTRFARILPHAVAAYFLYHVAGMIIAAAPNPAGGMSRANWRDPTVQEEFKLLATRLQAVGWDVKPDELEEQLWQLAQTWMSVHRTIGRPFRKYHWLTGTNQSWRMFVAPHRYPSILHVDLRPSGEQEWRPVYAMHADTSRWRSGQLENDRMRSVVFRVGWPSSHGHYRSLAKWLSLQAARDFPDAEAMRVRLYKYRTLGPDEVLAGRQPDGQFVREQVFSLDTLR